MSIRFKDIAAPLLGLLLVGGVWLTGLCFFVVQEGQQVILTQFGRPVGDAITEAGLKFKLPWRRANMMEKRILNWDGLPRQMPTKDKKFISVDTTARWKIADPLLFLKTLRTRDDAIIKMNSIIETATEETISSHNLVEAVRTTNEIIERNEARQVELREISASGLPVEEEEIIGEIEKIKVGREQLSEIITEKARTKLTPLGITLIDVQLRRISYEESVEDKVYERMVSERERIAEKIRAIGKGKEAEISGKVAKELQQIESQAYRTVQSIKGEAEEKSTKIYAETFGKDAEFYEFYRSLELYRKGLDADDKLILSAQSRFFEVLKNGK